MEWFNFTEEDRKNISEFMESNGYLFPPDFDFFSKKFVKEVAEGDTKRDNVAFVHKDYANKR